MLKTFVVEKFEKDCENQGVWKKMTCEDPLASGYPTAVQLSRRSSVIVSEQKLPNIVSKIGKITYTRGVRTRPVQKLVMLY